MAIGLVRACLTLAAQQTGIAPGSFVVLAMGKLGGWELNYSSDIDLLFVAKRNTDNYTPPGETIDREYRQYYSGGVSLSCGFASAPVGE